MVVEADQGPPYMFDASDGEPNLWRTRRGRPHHPDTLLPPQSRAPLTLDVHCLSFVPSDETAGKGISNGKGWPLVRIHTRLDELLIIDPTRTSIYDRVFEPELLRST